MDYGLKIHYDVFKWIYDNYDGETLETDETLIIYSKMDSRWALFYTKYKRGTYPECSEGNCVYLDFDMDTTDDDFVDVVAPIDLMEIYSKLYKSRGDSK